MSENAGRPRLSRRRFVGVAAAAGYLLPGASARAEGSQKDALRRVPIEGVHLGGTIGAAIDRTVRNRILGQNPDVLVEPFRHRGEQRCWQTEFWGKWFLAAAAAYRYTQDRSLHAALEQSAHGIIATQTADGYIGNYADAHHLEQWDIWGRKYTLLGLLAWHEISNEPKALEAGARLIDHLITEVGPGKTDIVKTGNFRGMASCSILEPVVLLYRATGEERYLRFAEHIVERWSSNDGPRLVEKALAGTPVAERFPPPRDWWSWDNGQKAYEMMSCYDGLLELFRVTGRSEHLSAVVKAAANIRDTEVNIAGSGASLECWYGGAAAQVQPARHMMETCVTTTWMQLCGNLLRLTGDSRYGDEIERTAYNALLSAMTRDGSSFAKYSPLEGSRELGPPQCEMGLNCCTANGPRGLMMLPELAVLQSESGVMVNSYGEGSARVPLAAGLEVLIRQSTDYPRGGAIRIAIGPSRAVRFPLGLRIPQWSDRTVVRINGGDPRTPRPGAYFVLDQEWKPGDVVSLELDMRGRIQRIPSDPFHHQAITRGPIVLARDSRLPGEPVDEPLRPVTDTGGFVPMEPASTPEGSDVWLGFRAKFSNGPQDKSGEMVLCDYASAGNTWDSGSRFRVWLRQELDPSRGLV